MDATAIHRSDSANDDRFVSRLFRFLGRPPLLAAIAGAVCFVNVLPNDFTYDDHLVVRTNPLVTEPGHALAIWTTDMWAPVAYAGPNRDLLYRPLTITSYRVMHQVFGGKPWPQLFVNVLIHALICALVVCLAIELGLTPGGATLAGFLFAVLPIHTEVVAGVVGRADLLASTGVLCALLAHCRSLSASSKVGAFLWTVVSVVGVIAAVFSKENGVAVVPLLILIDVYLWRASSSKSAGRTVLIRIARLIVLMIPAALYFALRYHALGGRLYQDAPISKTVNVLVDTQTWQHALGVVQLWGMYWVKTFWPAVLSIKYSINAVRPASSMMDGYVIAGLLAVGVLIALSIRGWRNGQRLPAFFCAALLLTHAPTSSAFVLMQVYFAERIWYLPSVWVCLLAGWSRPRI